MGEDKKPLGIPAVISLVCGASVGIFTKTALAPIDRSKIIFIKNQCGSGIKKAAHSLYTLVSTQGVKGIWRGHLSTVLRLAPYSAGRYFLYQNVKDYYANPTAENQHRAFVNIGIGMTCFLMSYPFLTARCRLAVTNKRRYMGSHHAFRLMFAREGPRAMYNGIFYCLCGVISYNVLNFGLFEVFKYELRTKTKHKYTHSWRLTFAFLSGLTASLVAYPFDVLRHLIQADGCCPTSNYGGVIHTAARAVTVNGFRKGLYVSLAYNLYKSVTSSALGLAFYDTFVCELGGY